ncbi:hypothetical protein [Rhodoferax sp. GW822-FHT02A01]|uniref:hypothetical protein n=1 Tax=Rhodoferax sp. GW822-FHT02A01 TaxID=3141537 RepID=UPI00315CFB9B
MNDLLRTDDPFILTPWTSGFGEDPCVQFQLTPEQAATRDALYRQMVASILLDHDPAMVSSLFEAGAKVFAMPGFFFIGNPSMEFSADLAVAKKLVMLPWAESHETAH